MSSARARACANIALVKYWGKRDTALNLPAVGSLSATLAGLRTETRVAFDRSLGADQVLLDGEARSAEVARVVAFLDRVRQLAGLETRARVESRNDFPTGAGLASSASGFAALALAATRAAGLALTDAELSALARLGSGSAPRSLHGGFVEMRRGERADGADAIAAPLFAAEHWPLEVVIAVTAAGRKPLGSTAAMELSRTTSPYYAAWVEGSDADLDEARAAIGARDFARLAAVAEHSCLKMHAVAVSSQPGVVYWNGATVELVHWARAARAGGRAVFFTIDGGPQVKLFCAPGEANAVAAELAAVPGVVRLLRSGLGPAAALVPDDSAAPASP